MKDGWRYGLRKESTTGELSERALYFAPLFGVAPTTISEGGRVWHWEPEPWPSEDDPDAEEKIIGKLVSYTIEFAPAYDEEFGSGILAHGWG